MRVLELYCGIGGFAQATQGLTTTVAAIDQSAVALSVYAHNAPSAPTLSWNLERVDASELARLDADMWWLSPPCQPYTVRGRRRDIEDARARSFVNLIRVLRTVQPRLLGLENVVGFQSSQARQLLLEALSRSGYSIQERTLCPTELGVPNRRPRYYLFAALDALLQPWETVLQDTFTGQTGTGGSPHQRHHGGRLCDYLDATPSRDLIVDASTVSRFHPGWDILDTRDPEACATCFTSAYGKSLMHSGSYLREGDRIRRFSPAEILRLLHFPASFAFPDYVPLRKQWHLAGNSLSVAALRKVLRVIPELRNGESEPPFLKTPSS
ncbi:MAG: DNA cytosine methyltransferase [Acidobacteriota bacterium]